MPVSSGDLEAGSGGKLVEVGFARDAVEGELIKGLLENAGIPCLLQQARLNVDGPQLGFGLATSGFGGGPQRVMVHADRAQQARSLLAETLVESGEDELPEIGEPEYGEADGGGRARNYGVIGAYARAIAWSIVFFLLAFGVFLLLRVG